MKKVFILSLYFSAGITVFGTLSYYLISLGLGFDNWFKFILALIAIFGSLAATAPVFIFSDLVGLQDSYWLFTEGFATEPTFIGWILDFILWLAFFYIILWVIWKLNLKSSLSKK
jgi:hypothetical protein